MTDTYTPTETPEQTLFSLLGKLNVTLTRQQTAMEQQARALLNPRPNESTRFIRITGAVTLDANGFGVIGFDNTVDQGYFWNVRKLVVGGLTPTTTAAGRADVFVTASDLRRVTSLAQTSLADWQDQATSLPLVGPYGDGELVCQENEFLFVIVSGGTSGQQIVCAGTVKQQQDGAAMNVSTR